MVGLHRIQGQWHLTGIQHPVLTRAETIPQHSTSTWAHTNPSTWQGWAQSSSPRWRRGLREPRPRGREALPPAGPSGRWAALPSPAARGAGTGCGMRRAGYGVRRTGYKGQDTGGRVVAAKPSDVPGWQAARGDGATDRGGPAAPGAGGWPREAAEAALCSSEPAAAPLWARSRPASDG